MNGDNVKGMLLIVAVVLAGCGGEPPPPPPPPPPASPFDGIFMGSFLVNESCTFGQGVSGATGNNQTISILEGPVGNLNISVAQAPGQPLMTCAGQTGSVRTALSAAIDSISCVRPTANDPSKQERVDVNGGTLQISTDGSRLVLHVYGTIWPLNDVCPTTEDANLLRQ